MTTKRTTDNGSRDDSSSDLAALWQVALSEYALASGLDLAAIPKYHTFADIKADRSVQKGFEEFRKSGGNMMKLGHLLSTNTELVIKSAQYVANAASAAFPPSAAILTALTLVMTAAQDVSKDYDTIMTFFEEFNSFLERVEMLEDKLPQFDGYRNHLLNVFSAMLKMCAIARKAVKERRLKRFGKTILRGGSDSALTEATGSLETAMKRLESATGIAALATGVATLSGVQDVRESSGRIESQSIEIHHLVTGMNATQQRSEAEMREQFQAMSARFDRLYENQSRAAASAASQAGMQSMDPGLRKQAAFNIVNSIFPTRDSPVSHTREIKHEIIDSTTVWFQEKQEYVLWKEGISNKNVLWLSGPAGSGKSCIAYLVHEDLKLSTASEAETSVAAIYLKDFVEDEHPEQGMLCSIINQIAARNPEYCEQVAAAFSRASSIPDWTDEDIVKDLWRLYVAAHFGNDSKSRLFLILDGADESKSAGGMVSNFLRQIVSDKLHMMICVTSRPLWEFPRKDLGEAFTEIQLRKEDVRSDMQKLVVTRIASHPRLYRCRKQTKSWILSQVLAKADTLLSAEHMLLELGNIHQESMIIKQLRETPGTLHDLFERLESVILTNRRPHQVKALQTLFAWLAFANRPLTVSDANALLRMHLDDRFFNIEEELSGASGQIMEITSIMDDENLGLGSDDTQQTPEEEEYQNKISSLDIMDNPESASDGAESILRFRSRSLRDFFTSTSDKEDRLRSSPAKSHAAIFEMSVNLLCRVGLESLEEHQREIGEALIHYAASNWSYHFSQIDMNGLNDDQIVKVLHSLVNIMTNKNDAVELIEKHSGEHETIVSSMNWAMQKYDLIVDNLDQWLEKGKELGRDRLADDFDWIEKSSDKESHIMLSSLQGHTRNWLKQVDGPRFLGSYGLMLVAFVMMDDKDFGSGLEFLEDADYVSAKTAKFLALYSGDPQDWATHRSIGVALSKFSHPDESMASFDLALTLADTEIERAKVLFAIADCGHAYLVNSALFPTSKTLAQEMQGDPAEVNGAASSGEGIDSNGSEMSEGITQLSSIVSTRDFNHYREIAENVLSTFSRSTLDDRQEWIRKCTLVIARCYHEMGRTEEAIKSYEEAQKALPDVPLSAQEYYMMARTSEQLGVGEFVERMQRWNFFEIMTWAGTHLLDSVTMNHPWHHLDPLHKAAKTLGKQAFVVDLYERIISYQEARGGEVEMRFRLGCLYLWDYYDMDNALSNAREQFYKVLKSKSQKNLINGTNGTWLLPAARDLIIEIAYEQFRTTLDLSGKQDLLAEVRRLQEENINEALRNTDPEESSSAIIYACMLRKVGSNVEYAEVLDRVFQSCITALKDVDGANDQASLILLAKVLACVPGLGEDAQIAYSAQYSIIDQKIALTGTDGKLGVEHDSTAWYSNQGFGSVDMIPLDQDDEPVDAAEQDDEPANAEGDKNVQPISAEEDDDKADAGEESSVSEASEPARRYKYATHPQWGDIMPCKTVFCQGQHRHKIVHWENVPNYLCIICTEAQLCAGCYGNIQSVNDGSKTWDDIGGSKYCGRDHRYVKGPIAGWRGIRDGYLTIAKDGTEQKTLFHDWLAGLEDKWKAAWDRFWNKEELDSVLG